MYKEPLPQFLVFAKRKSDKVAFAHLYVRITLLDERHDKSLGIKCLFINWESEKLLIKDDPEATVRLTQALEDVKQKIIGFYHFCKQHNSSISLADLLEAFNPEGRKTNFLSFSQCFTDLISKMDKAKNSEGNSETNIRKHKKCLDHFTNFCKEYYQCSDLPFRKITKTTVNDLFDFLTCTGNCCHNTAMKYMQIVKKVYRIGIENGWVKDNAFIGFKFRMKKVDRQYLTEQELEIIRSREFSFNRLTQVKDFFLFSCFTGLAYIDIQNLKRKNLVQNGEIFWIKTKRTKTDVEASIPLLPPAQAILKKYNPDWKDFGSEKTLLQIISNQKMNAYLKEIADLCKIEKNMTFHLARHTFATTVALSNNIPIETVSKMLGHTRISMTQHYSKVVDLKIARDTKHLFDKFSG